MLCSHAIRNTILCYKWHNYSKILYFWYSSKPRLVSWKHCRWTSHRGCMESIENIRAGTFLHIENHAAIDEFLPDHAWCMAFRSPQMPRPSNLPSIDPKPETQNMWAGEYNINVCMSSHDPNSQAGLGTEMCREELGWYSEDGDQFAGS